MSASARHDPHRQYARYNCQICRRPFDRKDVLSRHMRVHDAQRPPPGARRKACQSCVHSKTRCDGQRPTCSSCTRRNLACIYDELAISRYKRQLPQKSSRRTAANSDENQRAVIQALFQASPPEENTLLDSRPTQALSNENAVQQGGVHVRSPDRDLAALDDRSPKESRTWDQGLPFMCYDDEDFGTNVDWIFDDDISYFQPDVLGLPAPSSYEDAQSQLPLIAASQIPVQARAEKRPTVSSSASELPGVNDVLGTLLAPQPQETLDHGDPWPLESARPPPKHVILPSLGSMPQEPSNASGRYYSVTGITDRTWHALQKCLRLPFEHNTLQTLDLDGFPSVDQLDQCIDLYFAHFHPMLSIIHQPTFDPGKDLLVTIAIVCIGVSYTQFPGAKAFSIVLSELNRHLLAFMAEYDHRFVRTESFLVAQLLQGIHGYSSGSERLFELSESCRHSLIYHTKCMGLFRSECATRVAPGSTIEEIWRNFIRVEGSRRLGWAVFQYDVSVAYLHNSRPFLNAADVNLNLPSSTEHWQAESPEVWVSLHPWSRHAPSMPPLRSKLTAFFDGSPDPAADLHDEEHLFLAVLMLFRMIWTMREIKSFHLHDLALPLMYENGRQTLLRAIDQMRVQIVAAVESQTQAEMERLVLRTQIVHIAHIYAAGDLMDWLFPYLRNDLEKDKIRIRMRQWADEDPERMREVAYHSAQIIGLVRHYPTQMPLLSFFLFHAGVVLSCMSFLLPDISTSDCAPSIQLDKLRSYTENCFTTTEWIRNGGSATLRMIGVPSLCCPTGRQQVLNQTVSLLKRHKTWGITNTLTRIVLALSRRAA